MLHPFMRLFLSKQIRIFTRTFRAVGPDIRFYESYLETLCRRVFSIASLGVFRFLHNHVYIFISVELNKNAINVGRTLKRNKKLMPERT